MKKSEIIQHAARLMGDTSTSFVADIITPNFPLVMADLAQRECLGPLTRVVTFRVDEGKRIYDPREIAKTTPHFPSEVRALTVYAWGTEGCVEMVNPDRMRELRLSSGEDYRGQWRAWCGDIPGRLEVWPPADTDQDGDECEAVVLVPPSALQDADDVTQILAEDVLTVVHGLRFLGSGFKEDPTEKQESAALYEQGARRMWARLHNGRAGVVQPFDF